MKRLAHGTAKFIARVYCSDFVIVKPFSFIMFGNHAPRPIATPKNAVKQIIPAMTRVGNIRNTTAKGSLLVLLAASVESELKGRHILDFEPLEHVERFLAAAMRREIARRFRQGETENPHDQRAGADDDPRGPPDGVGRGGENRGAQQKHHRRADRPYAGAADEMHDGKNTSANELGRIFAGIGERQRLLGPEAEAGDEAADDKHRDVRRERTEDGEHAEQQQVELIDEAAAEPVAELTLSRGADEHAEDGRAANQRDLRAARELRRENVRYERAEDRKVDDVEEVSRGDQRDHFAVERRYLCVVERVADVRLYGLSHGLSLPIAFFVSTQQPP